MRYENAFVFEDGAEYIYPVDVMESSYGLPPVGIYPLDSLDPSDKGYWFAYGAAKGLEYSDIGSKLIEEHGRVISYAVLLG